MQVAKANHHSARSEHSGPTVATDRALALRHAPIIRFDRSEPFLPDLVGYTVFREDGASPSFPRQIELPDGVDLVIEYAVWWDWDIQHLYELEHIWVYLDAEDHVVHAEASWHGAHHTMRDENGNLPLENGRLTLWSEPGKHAFAPSRQTLLVRAPSTRRDCDALAGFRGLHVTRLFSQKLRMRRNPYINWLVVRYLRKHRFTPSFEFSTAVDLRGLEPVSWDVLQKWIPQRVTWWTRRLYALLLQEKRETLQASVDQVGTLEGLPPGVVRILDPIRESAPPRAGMTRMLWPVVMVLLTSLMVSTRLFWMGGQRMMALLHHIGVREQTRFARFQSDVRAELASTPFSEIMAAPPIPASLSVSPERLRP